MRVYITLIIIFALSACGDSGEPVNKVDNSKLTQSVERHTELTIVSSVSAVALSSASSVVAEKSKSAVFEEPKPLPNDFFKPKFDASDPAAPLEVAVTSNIGGGSEFVLPIMTIPMHPDQFPNGKNNRNGSIGKYMISQLIALPPNLDEDGVSIMIENEEQEVTKRGELFVAQENFMSSLPKSWIDYAGNSYKINGFISRDDGMVGGALGFQLKDENFNKNRAGGVLLSKAEGFLRERSISIDEWRKWPELMHELKYWGNEIIEHCYADKKKCQNEIEFLTSLKNLKGKGAELKLEGGHKIQYLNASSISNGSVGSVLRYNPDNVQPVVGTDILRVHLWRFINSDGTVKILHGGNHNESKIYFDECINDCKHQKYSTWTGSVISAKGKTYIIGDYADGHTYGYFVTEILPTELKPIGEFSWGD